MIRRNLFPKIQAHLGNPEITLIVGPRQAGKTTLMRQLQEVYHSSGGRTLFLSLDNDNDQPSFRSQDALIHRIELGIGKENGVVFIDEIQRRENAGLFLKGLYDRNLPYKLVVSGSGSVELKEKVHESLAGRKRLFELSTLSFTEFVRFKTEYRYEHQLADFFALQKLKAQTLFEEYLRFGGYPKVVLATTAEEKTQTIKDIYQSYLEKDVAYLLNIKKTEALTHLVRILASQIGNLVNVSELASTLGLSAKTVRAYVWYLEQTYIVERLTPFSKNVRKEITKTPVIYFTDLGMRNYANRTLEAASVANDGFLFENFIFLLLKEHLEAMQSLHFWRTQNKAEVDFVLDSGSEIVPIEAKFTELTQPKATRSFLSFLSQYHPHRAYVIHLGEELHRDIRGSRVSYLPYYRIERIFRP